jgi:hypothetical protein
MAKPRWEQPRAPLKRRHEDGNDSPCVSVPDRKLRCLNWCAGSDRLVRQLLRDVEKLEKRTRKQSPQHSGNQITPFASRFLAHEPLFRLGFASSLIGVAFHIGWALLFYELFKPVMRA